MSKRSLVLFFCVLFAILTSAPAAAQSFDCSPYLRARICPQMAICGSPELRSLDERMEEPYRALMRILPTHLANDELKRQAEWMENRDKCRCDVACLKKTYDARINGLRPYTGVGTPKQNGNAARNKEPLISDPTRFSTGTGFFVSPHGDMITNAHVVRGCIEVRPLNGGGYGEPLSVTAVHPEWDLALLRSSVTPRGYARLRAGKDPQLGEDVVVAGFPHADKVGRHLQVTTGVVSGLRGFGDERHAIQVSAPVSGGNSGGPVLADNGAVIGVIKAQISPKTMNGIDVPQNINFAVSLNSLQSFLDSLGVAYQTEQRSEKRSRARIALAALRFTVLLACRSSDERPGGAGAAAATNRLPAPAKVRSRSAKEPQGRMRREPSSAVDRKTGATR